jgi:hypothetical protein
VSVIFVRMYWYILGEQVCTQSVLGKALVHTGMLAARDSMIHAQL